MEPQETNTSHQEQRRAPFQYSLRSIFVVMTALAVFLSLVLAGPLWVSLLTATLLAIAAPMVFTVLLIYGRGRLRTFCIGALFPAGVLLWDGLRIGITMVVYGRPSSAFFADSDDDEVKAAVTITMLASSLVIVAFGELALAVRWLVESSRSGSSQRNSPPSGASPSDDVAAPQPEAHK